MRYFTVEELKKFNGKNGMPAYIAYMGRVYDLSDSFLWKNGEHQAFHSAGNDLTDALKDAPHGEEFIKKFPVIGYLKLSGK